MSLKEVEKEIMKAGSYVGYSDKKGRNAIHGSDSDENAIIESGPSRRRGRIPEARMSPSGVPRGR